MPRPFVATYVGGTFCNSEELLVTLLYENDRSGASEDDVPGCGNLFIPMDFTVTPLRFVWRTGDVVLVARIVNLLGDEAFIILQVRQKHLVYVLGSPKIP